MDDTLRALERTAKDEPGDDAAACAFLLALARSTEELPVVEPFRLGERSLLGPLFALEAERLGSIDPTILFHDEKGVGWVDAVSDRGRALFAATLRLRLVQLGHLAREARASFGSLFALHAALDADRDVALERLDVLLIEPASLAADRVVELLAQRSEPEVGRHLARLARTFPAEARPRLYRALASGLVPLDDVARGDLRAAIVREPSATRAAAYEALVRGASVDDIRKDHALGPPEVRAAALRLLLARVERAEGEAILRRALVDKEPLVRRKSLDVFLDSPTWSNHARAADWGMGRLLDADRAVRHKALKLVRRVVLTARQLPRLRLIVEKAPPGIRPGLERLLEHQERRAR